MRASNHKIRRMAWYIGVLFAAVLTVLAFLTRKGLPQSRNLMLTIALVILVWALKRNTDLVSIADVYRGKGVTDEMFDNGSAQKMTQAEAANDVHHS